MKLLFQTLALAAMAASSLLLAACDREPSPQNPPAEKQVDESPKQAANEPPVDPDSLTAKLADRRAASANRPPTTQRDVMAKAKADLEASGLAGKARNVGDVAVDFQLPDAEGNVVKLAELRARGPVVVTFYRGGWCPYCNMELAAYQAEYEKIKATGASLVAVSPETASNATETAAKGKLDFPLLTDVNNAVARMYGLVFQVPPELKEVYEGFGLDLAKSQGNDKWELPIPATYIIARDGTIVAAYVNSDYTYRMDPKDVVKKLEELQRTGIRDQGSGNRDQGTGNRIWTSPRTVGAP